FHRAFVAATPADIEYDVLRPQYRDSVLLLALLAVGRCHCEQPGLVHIADKNVSAVRLEKFDGVSRRIVQQDFRSAGARNVTVPDVQVGLPELGDFILQIIDADYDTVPPSRLCLATIGHGFRRPAWSKWCTQNQIQIAPRHDREIWRGP